MPFLERVTAGRQVPPERVAAVAEHYYDQGGASPINSQCRAILANLTEALAGSGLALYWGNRNWHPLLEDTVARMSEDGVERALALVTSAYGGYSSCRQYLEDISAARAKVGPRAPAIDKIRLYYNHPGWVGAWAQSLRRALGQCDPGQEVAVVFSAHSIPETMASTSPYVHHLRQSCTLVAEAAGVSEWALAWQSRSGSPAQPWLGPDINDVLASSGATAFVVVPIGFVCDNMEVVHDLDVEAAGTAKQKGAQFVRATTVGTQPAFAQMAHQLVQERLSSPRPDRAALGLDGPWPDACPSGHCPPPARPLPER